MDMCEKEITINNKKIKSCGILASFAKGDYLDEK